MGRTQSKAARRINAMGAGDTYFHKFLVTKDRKAQIRHIQNAAIRSFGKGAYTTKLSVKDGIGGMLVTCNDPALSVDKAKTNMSAITSSTAMKINTPLAKDDTFSIETNLTPPKNHHGREPSKESVKIIKTLGVLKAGESFCVPRRQGVGYNSDYQHIYRRAKSQLGCGNFTISAVQNNGVDALRCFRLA